MRSTRFVLILAGLGVIIAILATGIVYALGRPSNLAVPSPSGTTDVGPTSPPKSTPRATKQSENPTGRAWQTTTPQPAPTAARPSDLNRRGMDPEELVTAAAQVMTTWDTTKDLSPSDGRRRALPLFVDEYQDIFVTPEKPVLPEDWWEAAEHDARSTAQVHITDTYSQGGTRTYYLVVSWTWHSEGGWTLTPDPEHMTFQVSMDEIGYVIQNWTNQQLQ